MLSFEEYVDRDALGLATLIRDGKVSAAEVVEAALARVDAVEPKINAIVARRDDVARAQAAGPQGKGPFSRRALRLQGPGMLAGGLAGGSGLESL